MKNKGFTLVEVLGVIVILGLIAVIVYPKMKSIINENQQNLYNEQIERYKSVAATYVSDKTDTLTIGSDLYITIKYLYKGGYIKSQDLVDPRTQKTITGSCIHAIWDSTHNGYNYTYEEVCSK